MQTIELPALAWSPLTNTLQRARFSPHHNLLSAHPHLLLLFSTILTGEPVQNLCSPFSCAFSPAAAEEWAGLLFRSHEWCFGKGGTWTLSWGVTAFLLQNTWPQTSKQGELDFNSLQRGQIPALVRICLWSTAGSACTPQHRNRDISNKILNTVKVDSSARKALVIQYVNNLFSFLSLL